MRRSKGKKKERVESRKKRVKEKGKKGREEEVREVFFMKHGTLTGKRSESIKIFSFSDKCKEIRTKMKS